MEKLEFVRIEKFNYNDDDKKNYLPESLLVKFPDRERSVLYYRKNDVDKYKNEIEQLKQQIRELKNNREADKEIIYQFIKDLKDKIYKIEKLEVENMEKDKEIVFLREEQDKYDECILKYIEAMKTMNNQEEFIKTLIRTLKRHQSTIFDFIEDDKKQENKIKELEIELNKEKSFTVDKKTILEFLEYLKQQKGEIL